MSDFASLWYMQNMQVEYIISSVFCILDEHYCKTNDPCAGPCQRPWVVHIKSFDSGLRHTCDPLTTEQRVART